jgi:hypothetical protein
MNNNKETNAEFFNRIADEAMMKSRIESCAKEMETMMKKQYEKPKTRLETLVDKLFVY